VWLQRVSFIMSVRENVYPLTSRAMAPAAG
jgi:hypothetical protein